MFYKLLANTFTRKALINVLLVKLEKEVKRTDNVIDDNLVAVLKTAYHTDSNDQVGQELMADMLSKLVRKFKDRVRYIKNKNKSNEA